jgi:hypothetical protein
MVTSIFYYEIKNSLDSQYQEESNVNVKHAIVACLIINSFSNFFFSIFILIIVLTIIFRYLLYIEMKQVTVDFSKISNLWNTGLIFPLLFEISLAVAHPNLLLEGIFF